MRRVRECQCCVPGCGRTVRLTPFMTVRELVDLTEGLCREHLRAVDPEWRMLLRQARLDLRLFPFLEEANLFRRAWQVVKLQAIERASGRAAA